MSAHQSILQFKLLCMPGMVQTSLKKNQVWKILAANYQPGGVNELGFVRIPVIDCCSQYICDVGIGTIEEFDDH